MQWYDRDAVIHGCYTWVCCCCWSAWCYQSQPI